DALLTVELPETRVREETMSALEETSSKEYKAGGSTYQQQVQKAMRGPYSKHSAQGLCPQAHAYYEALHLPLDADTFIQRLQAEMTTALEQLNQSIPDNPHVRLLREAAGSPSRRCLLSHNPSTCGCSKLNCSHAGRWSNCSISSRE